MDSVNWSALDQAIKESKELRKSLTGQFNKRLISQQQYQDRLHQVTNLQGQLDQLCAIQREWQQQKKNNIDKAYPLLDTIEASEWPFVTAEVRSRLQKVQGCYKRAQMIRQWVQDSWKRGSSWRDNRRLSQFKKLLTEQKKLDLDIGIRSKRIKLKIRDQASPTKRADQGASSDGLELIVCIYEKVAKVARRVARLETKISTEKHTIAAMQRWLKQLKQSRPQNQPISHQDLISAEYLTRSEALNPMVYSKKRMTLASGYIGQWKKSQQGPAASRAQVSRKKNDTRSGEQIEV